MPGRLHHAVASGAESVDRVRYYITRRAGSRVGRPSAALRDRSIVFRDIKLSTVAAAAREARDRRRVLVQAARCSKGAMTLTAAAG